jgi:hypothetical protein
MKTLIPALALTAVLAQPAQATNIGDAILAGIATHAIISVIRGSQQPQPVYVPPVITHTGAYHPIILAPNHDPRVYRPQQTLPTVTRDGCAYNGQTVMVYGQDGRVIGYQICP